MRATFEAPLPDMLDLDRFTRASRTLEAMRAKPCWPKAGQRLKSSYAAVTGPAGGRLRDATIAAFRPDEFGIYMPMRQREARLATLPAPIPPGVCCTLSRLNGQTVTLGISAGS